MGGGNGVIHKTIQRKHAPKTPSLQWHTSKLTADDVVHIKKLLSDCGATITYEDCLTVRQYFPQVSASNIRSIAKNISWTNIPWPGKTPIYQDRKRKP